MESYSFVFVFVSVSDFDFCFCDGIILITVSFLYSHCNYSFTLDAKNYKSNDQPRGNLWCPKELQFGGME